MAAPANAVEVGRRREIYRRFSAALDRKGRDQFADGHAWTPEAAIVVTEASGDKTRMQAIRRDACSLEASGELTGEQDIGDLRALIGSPAAVVPSVTGLD